MLRCHVAQRRHAPTPSGFTQARFGAMMRHGHQVTPIDPRKPARKIADLGTRLSRHRTAKEQKEAH